MSGWRVPRVRRAHDRSPRPRLRIERDDLVPRDLLARAAHAEEHGATGEPLRPRDADFARCRIERIEHLAARPVGPDARDARRRVEVDVAIAAPVRAAAGYTLGRHFDNAAPLRRGRAQ